MSATPLGQTMGTPADQGMKLNPEDAVTSCHDPLVIFSGFESDLGGAVRVGAIQT